MNEERQKELKELLAKHSSEENKATATSDNTISVSEISGNNNNIYINSNVGAEDPKKN